MDINGFVKKFATIFDDTPEEDIKPETRFQELEEWSSLTAIALLVIAEEDFGRQLDADKMRACETVRDLFRLIAE